MKKQITIFALTLGAIVLGTNDAQAQSTSNPATTTVNITLADVISIDAGSEAINGTIDFDYSTAEDYNSDQSVRQTNALKVTSTKEFDVNVKAGGASFSDGSATIDVGVLTIKPIATSGGMGGIQTPVVLSDKDQPLVAKAPKGSALTLDLDYFIPKQKSRSSAILGKPAGTYTQKVIYTATAE